MLLRVAFVASVGLKIHCIDFGFELLLLVDRGNLLLLFLDLLVQLVVGKLDMFDLLSELVHLVFNLIAMLLDPLLVINEPRVSQPALPELGPPVVHHLETKRSG